MAKLSIIIPVFNVEKYIRRCVESIYAQNYEDIEVILIDDGSSDNSGKICDELASKDSRVKVIHTENSGCSSARNLGISLATGKYICFIDSDDEWLPLTLNKLLKKSDDEYDVIIYGAKTVDVKGNILGYERAGKENAYKGQEEVKEFLKSLSPGDKGWGLNYIWNRLYKTDVIKKNNILFNTKLNLGEDFVFNCEIMKHISSIYVSDELLYCYYKYFQNQLTMRFRENELERRDYMFEVHKNLYCFYKIYDEYKINCYIEEGIVTHYSIMKTTYVDCKLGMRDTVKYIESFLKSEHYVALMEYLKYKKDAVNGVMKCLYKIRNQYFIAVFAMILRKRNALKMGMK